MRQGRARRPELRGGRTGSHKLRVGKRATGVIAFRHSSLEFSPSDAAGIVLFNFSELGTAFVILTANTVFLELSERAAFCRHIPSMRAAAVLSPESAPSQRMITVEFGPGARAPRHGSLLEQGGGEGRKSRKRTKSLCQTDPPKPDQGRTLTLTRSVPPNRDSVLLGHGAHPIVHCFLLVHADRG
jgi:hypothetical protein